jgi:hypothetical protein
MTIVTSSGLNESDPVPLHAPLAMAADGMGAAGMGAAGIDATGLGAVGAGIDDIDPHADSQATTSAPASTAAVVLMPAN